MKAFLLGVVLGVAIGAVVTEVKGERATAQPLAYASAADVAMALRTIGAKDDSRPVVRLKPYTVLAEHRVATKSAAAEASIHKDEAELYYVIQGSATLVAGRTPDQPTGGTMQQIRTGDVLMIPENTPHWLNSVEEPLSYISMHVPRTNSSPGR